jgi:hypothetical protein
MLKVKVRYSVFSGITHYIVAQSHHARRYFKTAGIPSVTMTKRIVNGLLEESV